jgi:hypothetical protein
MLPRFLSATFWLVVAPTVVVAGVDAWRQARRWRASSRRVDVMAAVAVARKVN